MRPPRLIALLLAGALGAVLLGTGSGRPITVHAAAPALPSDRLHFGLSNGPGSLSWMTGSGVPWRYRYAYLAGGVNTAGDWTTWQDPAQPPGQYAVDYMNSSTSVANYIPVFTWYQLLQSSPSTGADEASRDYNNLNNAATMGSYYGSFKLLMQRAGAYGKPVVVHVEPDFWGYMQQRSGNTTAAGVSASVAGSGFAEVAAYPNTVAGFAQALLHLRDAYATNVVMATHASMWSSGQDLATSTDPALSAVTEADKTAAFLNSTGNWDAVFNDVDDHDAGWWESQGSNHWWDPANLAVPNFSRWLAWVSELHARTARPQVVWQVPVGNQYYLTMNNTCGHYQDNVAQYFLGHTAALFAAGLIAVLFGAGNGCQTNNEDVQNDGVTNNGGLPTTDVKGWCNQCNNHPSSVGDDDGGFLRTFVGAYYTATGATHVYYFTWYDHQSDGYFLTGADEIHVANPGTAAANVAIHIPGNPGCDLFSPVGAATQESFQCDTGFGGPVVVTSDQAVYATQRVKYAGSFNESRAQGLGSAGASLVFTWYDRVSDPTFAAGSDDVHLLNPNSTLAVVDVHIPGSPACDSVGAKVPAGSDQVFTCQTGFGGPVTVTSTNGVGVLGSQRVKYGASFNEAPAQLPSPGTTNLVYAWYDRISDLGFTSDDVHVYDPGGVDAVVNVHIPGSPACDTTAFTIPKGTDHPFTCSTGFGGPVTVTSTNSVPVIGSQRVKYYGSFNEVPAVAASRGMLIATFPYYDVTSAGVESDNIHVVNPNSTPADIAIDVPGCSTIFSSTGALAGGSATLGAGTEDYYHCAGAGGPATVTSINGVSVLTSQRVKYYQSFNEVAPF